MRRRSRSITLFCLIAVCGVAAPGAANAALPTPPKEVMQAMTEKARQLFADGVKAYQRSRWADAHAAFLAAWALTKHYTIAGNLADCELKLGLHRDAAEHFALYVREMAKDGASTAQERQDGEERYARALAKVARADLEVSVPGSDVYVDGKLVGAAPFDGPVFLEPGSHAFEARHEGYGAARATITMTAGASERVTLWLTRAPELPPPPPPSSSSRGPGVAWIAATGALAAGGLGAGIGLTVAANEKGSDGSALGAKVGSRSACAGTPAAGVSADCAALKSALRSKSTLSDAAFATFLGGGVLALAAGGLGVWAGVTPKAKDERKTSIRVIPVIGAGDVGVIVVGAW